MRHEDTQYAKQVERTRSRYAPVTIGLRTKADQTGDEYERLRDGTWKRLRDGWIFQVAETRTTAVILRAVGRS